MNARCWKKMLRWAAVWCCFLVFVIPAQAQAASANWQAVIVAPASVELANTGAITIMVTLRRINSRLQDGPPAKIILETSNGRWIKDGAAATERSDANELSSPQAIEVPTSVAPCTATLLLADASDSTPLRVTARTVGNQAQNLGSTEIKLHHPAFLNFIAVPETVPADGKSTGKISLRLVDEQGNGIADAPFVLHGYGPPSSDDTEILASAITDSNGRASFALPASSHVGPALVQVIGAGILNYPIVTPQLEIEFGDRGQPNPSPVLADRNWWRKPYDLRGQAR